jgi:hypothetical protein
MRSEDRDFGSRLDHLNDSLVEVRCIVGGQRPFNARVKSTIRRCNEAEFPITTRYSSSISDHDSDSDEELRGQEDDKTATTESGKSTPTSYTKRKKSHSSLTKLLLQLQRTSSPQRPPPPPRRSSATLPVSWPTRSRVGPEEDLRDVCRSHSFGSMLNEPSPGATKVHKLFRWCPKKLPIQDHDSTVQQVITNKYAEQ